MAFLENSAANIHGLLEEFMQFAVLHAGFTRLANLTVSGYTNNRIYVLQKGAIYWWFGAISATQTYYGAYGEITGRMMLSAPTTSNILTATLGQYYRTRISLFNRPNGPYVKHRFYTDGQEVYAVLEITPGAYTHFGIGKIPKYGTWTGGEFLNGTHIALQSPYTSSGFPLLSSLVQYLDIPFGSGNTHRYNSDTYNGFNHIYNPARNQGNSADFAAAISGNYADTYLYKNFFQGSIPTTPTSAFIGLNLNKASKNTFNGRNIINGNLIYLNNNIIQDTTPRWIIAGAPALLRPVSMEGIAPADTIEVFWDCYPYFSKGGDKMAYPDSENLGIAYKRIV